MEETGAEEVGGKKVGNEKGVLRYTNHRTGAVWGICWAALHLTAIAGTRL